MRLEGTRSLSGGFGAEPPFLFHRLGAAIVVGNDQGESTGTAPTGQAAQAVAPPDLHLWFDLLAIRAETRGAESTSWPTSRAWLLLWVVAVSVFVCILTFAIQFLRTFDPGVRRPNKRAQAGDLDGAIEDLANKLKTKGQRRSVPTHLASSWRNMSAGLRPPPRFARRRSSGLPRACAKQISASRC